MTEKAIDLVKLLPAIYRIKDAESGGQIEAFLRLIEDQAQMIKEDIDGLWDDFFVETCAAWVVPYIGEVVGNRPMNYLDLQSRVDVARTINYRKRKGTLSMLEDLARDVTGWQARAVAFYEQLNWSQNAGHLRFDLQSGGSSSGLPIRADRIGTLNLANQDLLNRIDTSFDSASRTIDVRPMNSQQGRYNLNKIGFFLWRKESYRIAGASARKAEVAGGYYFSPLKEPIQLFCLRGDAGSYAGPAEETDVPGPIRPFNFHLHQEKYYGHGKSLAVYLGLEAKVDALLPASQVQLRNLEQWGSPPNGQVWLDLKLGRLLFPPDIDCSNGITVSYCYGFSSNLGGGPYRRLASGEKAGLLPLYVGKEQKIESIAQALQSWRDGCGNVIEIIDNGNYEGDLIIDASGSQSKILEIRAADEKRPVILGSIIVRGHLTNLVISGILIAGCIEIKDQGARIDQLNLSHCTLVPGYIKEAVSIIGDNPEGFIEGSLQSSASSVGSTDISFCITGPLYVAWDMQRLKLTDCIIDAHQGPAIAGADDSSPGPRLWMERCTVFGSIKVRMLEMATEVICTETIEASQIQAGCVRFSHVTLNSRVPRRFRCVPGDVSMDRAKYLTPVFVSKDYGHPAYAELSDLSPEEILSGAEDGSEMGAFCHLKRQKRVANLQTRLQEYMPAGLEPAIIFVN